MELERKQFYSFLAVLMIEVLIILILFGAL